MRLIIYGGTRSDIRCRIGEWGQVNTGLLSEQYGISDNEWAIGFGIDKENGYLFLKTFKEYQGRQYPFSLMLDPGEEIWGQFEWNAANLAYSLKKNPENLLSKLFYEAESISESNLSGMIRHLQKYTFDPILDKVSLIIAGSISENELFGLSLSHLGQEFVGFSKNLASQLQSLPPFLRTGKGWMFKVGVANVIDMGVGLVFDKNISEIDQAKLDKILDNGSRILQNWRSLDENSKQKLKSLSQIPTWLWQKKYGQLPFEIFARIDHLASLNQTNQVLDKDLFEARTKQGLLDEEINQKVLDNALNSNELCTAERTYYFLETVPLDKLLKSNVVQKNLLDLKTVSDWLMEKGIFPGDSPIPVQFNEQQKYEICQTIISSKNDLELIPDLFEKAISEISDNENKDQLAQTVWQKTKPRMVDVWYSRIQKNYFIKYLKDFCEEEAKALTKLKSGDWLRSYLYFANDPGGYWLFDKNYIDQSLEFIEFILEITEKIPQIIVWLQKLSASPLRGKLPIEIKIKIVQKKQIPVSWDNFNRLLAILNGEQVKIKDPADDLEIPFLENELNQYKAANLLTKINEKQDIQLRKLLGKPSITNLPPESKPIGETRELIFPNEFINYENAVQIEQKFEGNIQKIDELQQMAEETLIDPEKRKKWFKDFADQNNSMLQQIFPYLNLELRITVLYLLLENDATELISKIKTNFEDREKVNSLDRFTLSLWETLLFFKPKRQIFEKMHAKGIGRGIKIEEEMHNAINDSIQKTKQKFGEEEEETPKSESNLWENLKKLIFRGK